MIEKNQTYQATLQNSVYFLQPQAGFLHLSGDDRVDFLQRQTTNDLRLLESDRYLMTVLTSPTARILDVLGIFADNDTLGLITLPGRQVDTFNFLRGRIFFSDQVSIQDLSGDHVQILLIGPQSNQLLTDLGISPPASDSWKFATLVGQRVIVIARRILFRIGYHLLVPAQSAETILAVLDQAGSTALIADVFEVLRVEAGQPGPLRELTVDYTPLEIQLQDLVSEKKGCYTGQEIIARQVNYDKITKRLMGIRLDGAIGAGTKIEVEGKAVGTLTSVVESPRFGWIGLGIIRRPFYEVGQKLLIVASDDHQVGGTVSALPFEPK